MKMMMILASGNKIIDWGARCVFLEHWWRIDIYRISKCPLSIILSNVVYDDFPIFYVISSEYSWDTKTDRIDETIRDMSRKRF